jgi:hypothetical protein
MALRIVNMITPMDAPSAVRKRSEAMIVMAIILCDSRPKIGRSVDSVSHLISTLVHHLFLLVKRHDSCGKALDKIVDESWITLEKAKGVNSRSLAFDAGSTAFRVLYLRRLLQACGAYHNFAAVPLWALPPTEMQR